MLGRIHANPFGDLLPDFFKWTWRLLNFVREMVLNLFFIFLVLVGVGIWMQVSGGDSKETASRGALLLDISGVIVDKPDSSQRFSKLSPPAAWCQFRSSAGKLTV